MISVYKKSSNNGKVVMFIINRDLVIGEDSITPLRGVVRIDAEEFRNKKV